MIAMVTGHQNASNGTGTIRFHSATTIRSDSLGAFFGVHLNLNLKASGCQQIGGQLAL